MNKCEAHAGHTHIGGAARPGTPLHTADRETMAQKNCTWERHFPLECRRSCIAQRHHAPAPMRVDQEAEVSPPRRKLLQRRRHCVFDLDLSETSAMKVAANARATMRSAVGTATAYQRSGKREWNQTTFSSTNGVSTAQAV
mmetsp:Transcript_48966/g.129205  ORF Transcript_48966/g.129205 Transcript_48966/m.129205 type:complete len:141 (-) Transcript_48966:140-562(-)